MRLAKAEHYLDDRREPRAEESDRVTLTTRQLDVIVAEIAGVITRAQRAHGELEAAEAAAAAVPPAAAPGWRARG